MRPTVEQDQLEKAKAEQIVAETPLMDGVDHIAVELADDHDGDPSMWLQFYLQAGFKPEAHWCEQFVTYSNELSREILHSGLTRSPYTRLRPAA
jgi:hypothetical protein